MNQLSVRHLTGIRGLTLNDIELIFQAAKEFKEVINRPIKKVPSPAGPDDREFVL